jgi:uncharacterized protein (TIGR03067 family)
MHARAIAVLGFSVLSFGAAAPADSPPKKELAGLQGTWKLVSIERDGKVNDPDNQPRWVIKGDKVFYGGEELAVLTIDPGTTPKCVDLAFRSPKEVYEGIYAVEDKVLKICLNRETTGVKERPTAFSTKDKPNWRVFVFQREDAKDGDEYEGVPGFVGLMIGVDQGKGQVVVMGTVKGAAADKAGLQADDVILRVGTTEVSDDIRTAVNAVRQTKPGSELTFKVKRKDKEQDIKVKVGALPFQLH